MSSFQTLMGQISVEVDGLRAAAVDLRSVLDSSYRVQVPKVYDSMQPGAQVGGQLAQHEWVGLQQQYDKCLQATSDALHNIDLGTQALAKAAETVAQRYGDADGFARARATDVDAMLKIPPKPTVDENEKTGGYAL